MSAQEKVCRRCKIGRPATEFGRNAKAADGLQSYCRGCAVSYARERRKVRAGEGGKQRTVVVAGTLMARAVCPCCKSQVFVKVQDDPSLSGVEEQVKRLKAELARMEGRASAFLASRRGGPRLDLNSREAETDPQDVLPEGYDRDVAL